MPLLYIIFSSATTLCYATKLRNIHSIPFLVIDNLRVEYSYLLKGFTIKKELKRVAT